MEKVLSVVEAWTKEPKCSGEPGEMPGGVIASTPEAAHSVYVN
jgi:hypothetical protein